MEALAEEAEKVGIESKKTVLASAEQTAVKKKVKIVKKIVKKKVIKKVPKRVSVAPNSNDLGKIASPNSNDNAPMETEAIVPVEVEKPNGVVKDLREDELMKEFDDSDREKGVRLVETNDSCRDENERSDLVTTPPLVETNDSCRDEINSMNVEEHEGEEDVKSFKMDTGLSKCTKVDGSLKEQDEKIECVSGKIESGISNDVKGEEGIKEQVDRRQHMKQRTKIFIHGLDSETKEEDIRKVFQEVGEVVEVKIITNFRSGKSRGFGFIRYASAGLAKLALMKYHHVEICGRVCHTAAIEGNDTILLSNIDKRWNSEYVLALLQKIGVNKIDEVSVVADPENTELNRGFAYVELETKRDAQIAYRKLQNKDVFGKHSTIKVAWAEPSADPVEEEMHNIKSVYAERIPSSWDEEEVKDQFKIFGEIESIALAKNLFTAKRNDFAFINYKTHEAALSCIEALTCKQLANDYGPKAHLKVSLAKSIPKGKPIKTMPEPAVTEASKVKQKLNPAVYKPHKPITVKASSSSRREGSRNNGGSSTTAELVQILREQASWKLGGPTSTTGMSSGHHHQPPPSGGKRPLIELGSKSLYHDPRAYHQTHIQIPNVPHPRPIVNGVDVSSLPHIDQQPARYTIGSLNTVRANPMYFRTRDQATYPGSSNIYRQMH